MNIYYHNKWNFNPPKWAIIYVHGSTSILSGKLMLLAIRRSFETRGRNSLIKRNTVLG
jgi:hypothetical protein